MPAHQPPVVGCPAATQAEPPAAPIPPPSVVAATEGNIPVPGQLYADRLPFGSQSVPLPPGRWLAVAVSNNPPTSGVPNASVFLRWSWANRSLRARWSADQRRWNRKRTGFWCPRTRRYPHSITAAC